MSDEEWVKVATEDDEMVAELLLMFKRVNQTTAGVPGIASPTSQSAMTSKQPPLSVKWKVRQRRSKQVTTVQSKKQAPIASPTTPLSWSGGATSVSGGAGGSGSGGGGSGVVGGEGDGDGYGGVGFDGSPEEESSRPSVNPPPPPQPLKSSDISRSKVIGTGETTSTKRARRKKTLSELKEEEDLLQKERRQLKRDLTTLRLHLEKAKATNEKLKRIKIELEPPAESDNGSKVSTELVNSDQLQQRMATSNDDNSTAIASKSLECCLTNSYSAVEEKHSSSKFVLPDLNLPLEETSNPDILCGVS